MHRIDTSTARPDLNGPGKKGFSDNLDLPGQDATYLSAAWCNAVQEELASVIEYAELPLNKGDNQQLWEALVKVFTTNETFKTFQSSVEKDISELRSDLQGKIDAINKRLDSYFGAQGNGTYTTPGTYQIQVAAGTKKRIRLWGAGGAGGGAYGGNAYDTGTPTATDGGDTTIALIGLTAGGGKSGTSGAWANGSAYRNGAAGAGGTASGGNTTNTNGNSGTASQTNQAGGAAIEGYGAGSKGEPGTGDEGWSYGGGGGSGAYIDHTYSNDTDALVTLTLVIGSGGALEGKPDLVGGNGAAIIESM